MRLGMVVESIGFIVGDDDGALRPILAAGDGVDRVRQKSFADLQVRITRMVVISLERGLHRRAGRAGKQAVELDPESAQFRGFLGYAYTKLNMTSEAAAAFKAAIRLDPEDPRMHFGLGKVYVLMGERASALEEYKILKKVDAKSANELFDLIYKQP